MAESWEDLPDVEVKPQTKASWENLPDVAPAVDTKAAKRLASPAAAAVYASQHPDAGIPEKITPGQALSNPYAGQQAAAEAQAAVEDQARADAIPTLSQGSSFPIPPPDKATMEATHIEASKDTPIIPGLNGTSPQGIRAALAGATMNAAPRILAAIDDRPFNVALKDWHRLYSEAREEHPGMEMLGGVAAPLPFAKAGLGGKIAVGAAAGALSGWLGADPEDEGAKKEGALMGGVAGGLLMGAFHYGGAKLGKGVSKVGQIPGRGFTPDAPKVRVSVATPEFANDLGTSLDNVRLPDPELPAPKPQDTYSALKGLATDPKSVVPYKIPDLSKAKPLDASLIPGPNGLQAVVRELGPNGLGIHVTEVKDADALYRWKQAMIRSHPDTYIMGGDNPTVQSILQADDGMWRAMYPTPKLAAEAKVRVTSPHAGTNAGSPNRRISPADEAPGPRSREPSIMVQDAEGYVQLHELKTISAKTAALRAREIHAIDTPDGRRYVMDGAFKEPDGTRLVVPFDEYDDVPTIARVSRVKDARLLPVKDEELRALVDRRTKVGKGAKATSTPDVNEGTPQTKYMEDAAGETPLNKADPTEVSAPPPPPPGPEPLPVGPHGQPPPTNFKQLAIAEKVGNMNPLIRQLVHSSHRAEIDLADHITDFTSAKNVEKVKYNIYKALESGLGKKEAAQFRKDVYLAFEGSISEAKLAEMYPQQVYAQKREMLGQAIKRRNENHQWFVDNGHIDDSYLMDTDKLTEADFKGYVNREYAATNLPQGEYAKIVKRDDTKMKLAIAGFKNWELKQGRTISDEVALKRLMEAIGSKDPAELLFGSGATGGSGAKSALKRRQDLPEWYRAVLGENRDGFHAVARTLGKQEFNRANLEVFDKLAANPRYAKPEAALLPGEHATWTQLPNDRKTYGNAAGLMVPNFVHDAFVTLPNAHAGADGVLAAIYGTIKTNQMGYPSIRTLVNMWMSNIEAGMLAGGVDPTRPMASVKGLLYAGKAMHEFKKNPLADNEWAQFIRDARRIGADAPGHIGLDLNKMQQQTMDDMTAHLAGYKGEMDLPSVIGAINKVHKWGAKPGSMAVDGVDRLQKLASWKIIQDDLMAEPGSFASMFAGKGIGLDKEAAMRRAYRRIASYNPMFDRLAPLAERMKTGLVGAVSPYSSYGMERNRIWGMLPMNIAKSFRDGADDPGLPWRIAKWAGVLGAGYGMYGLAHQYAGTTDEVAAALQNRKGSLQDKLNPAPLVMPVHDADGKLVIMDVTGWSGALSFLQGDPNFSWLTRGAINTVRQPLADGILGEGLDYMGEQAGINMGSVPSGKPPIWQDGILEGGARLADSMIKKGAAPRIAVSSYDAVKSTGKLGDIGGMRKEVTSPSTATAKFLGAPIEGTQSVGTNMDGKINPSMLDKIKREQSDIGNARAAITKLMTMQPDRAVGPMQELLDLLTKGEPTEERKKLVDELVKQIKKHAEEIAKTGRLNRQAAEAKARREAAAKEKSP